MTDPAPMDRRVLDALLREDLSSFIERSFYELNPGIAFHRTWFLDLIAARLMAVAEGRIRRLIITLPPRSLKSISVSVAFTAWLLGRDPTRRLVCASYGQDLASALAQDARRLLQSAWYGELFPRTRLTSARPNVDDLRTTRGGGRLATSVGGALTGRGGDILIVDDPTKPDEALSDTQREAANTWFQHTLRSRLNDPANGAIIVVMQRQHPQDLVGFLLEQGEPWEVVELPAIASDPQTFTYEVLGQVVTHQRDVGDLLDPVRFPKELLEQLREELGSFHFQAQYQQVPVPPGGALIKTVWLTGYTPEEMPADFDTIVQSWDTAQKVTELSDFSVCTTWGIVNKKAYLLDVVREKYEFPDLKRAVQAQAQRWKPRVVLIEDQASGTALVQELKRDGLYQVKAVKPKGEKIMRIAAHSTMIESAVVLFPKGMPWWPEYEAELTRFPKARHDDQVDSTSQALDWISEHLQEPAFLTFMRMQVEKDRARRGP